MKKGKKILILGASSYIGSDLYRRLTPERALGTFNSHPVDGCIHFDVLNDSLGKVLKDHKSYSHAVIMLGNTKPDSCARNTKETDYLNVKRICNVIDELNGLHIVPVFMSTEVVFDGKNGNYIETDDASPVLRYGMQKVEVEKYLINNRRKFITVRLGKVYGCNMYEDTLFTAWLGKIMKNEEIICARDSVFSPVHIDDVSEGIIRLMENDSSGIFHLANRTAHTRLEMLNTLIRYYRKYRSQDKIKVTECSMWDLPTVEKRPLNISLNPMKVVRETGLVIRDIDASCDFITKKFFCRGN